MLPLVAVGYSHSPTAGSIPPSSPASLASADFRSRYLWKCDLECVAFGVVTWDGLGFVAFFQKSWAVQISTRRAWIMYSEVGLPSHHGHWKLVNFCMEHLAARISGFSLTG